MNPPLPSSASASSEPPPDEPLTTVQAFRRFVARVTRRAGGWLANRGVPPEDRDDVLQDALVQTYQKRASYDPAFGSWEAWAFGFVGHVVRNYRKTRGRRRRRVDVARVDLPDVAADGPNPEEETEEHMMQALREKCLASLDEDDRAMLLARAEGIPVTAIAKSFGVAESTARVYIKVARERLQAALDREERAKRALGVAVLPFTVDQLIGSNPAGADVSTETMTRVWKQLDRLMADDVAAGRLQDDGTDVERYMGTPDNTPRPSLLARALHALGPRAERDDITEEQALFDTGSNAYSAGRYTDAIAAFQEQARKHPRSQYPAVRDRLLILSLIGARRKSEASARIDRFRRANPGSATIQELETALRAAN